MPKMAYKLVKKIKRAGWPTTSKKWRSAHSKANLAEKKRFGKKAFAKVQAIVKKMPKDELLGTHTKKGLIRISKRVPKPYRPQIAYHEKVEHRIMTKRKK